MANLDTIFKAYDIRGRVPDELDAHTTQLIGRALADFLPAGTVAVGRDMRADSEQLAQAMINGLVQQGRIVLNLGQITSDMMYFVIGDMKLAGGAMITASHNAAGYNGVKLTGAGVVPIGQGSGLEKIKASINDNDFLKSNQPGHVDEINRITDFVSHAITVAEQNFGKLSSLNIGYDAGNGMAGIFVDALRQSTPLTIEGLYLELDGSFPNHPANPMVEQNLAALEKLEIKDHLQAGVAFDGDGDRAFLVDEQGKVLSASILGSLLAAETLKRHPGAKIIYSALCSHIVPETITANGGEPVISRVGHTFIKAKMKEFNAILGIEHSGHFYFADNYEADSGLIAALSALGILSNSNMVLSQLCAPYRKYFDSGEINFPAQDMTALLQMLQQKYADAQLSQIDGLSVEYSDWWFNVRPSNTEPVARLNIEAISSQLLEEKLKELKNELKILS